MELTVKSIFGRLNRMLGRRIAILCVLVMFTGEALASPFPPGFLTPTSTPRPSYTSIPMESNAYVRRWVKFFSVRDRARFDRFMTRGAQYRTLVQKILSENGVPPEMYYLAMIESGYSSHARSQARASGIWQFIAPTARRYGLRVDKDVDERLDIVRSTRAAARYLTDLEEQFGSWYLAMAAYNCGEGCVRSAIRRSGTKDFWRIARRGGLPSETVNYIPKFQAAMTIARDPQHYGFKTKTYFDFPDLHPVRIAQSMQLWAVARDNQVSLATMRALNPHLIKEKTPKNSRGYEVWVPRKKSASRTKIG
jgi:membrane-bound lytic murein transglycosylase D